MRHTGTTAMAIALALGAAGSARAVQPPPVLVQVAPGVYAPASQAAGAPMQVAPGVFSYTPTDTLPVAPGVYAQAPARPAPQAFTASVSGSFGLTLVDEVAESDTLTRATYTADGATIVLTPADVPGAPLRLTGRITIATQTTVDADGNGEITGTLTFTGRSTTGMVADLITARLHGTYGEKASPLEVTGDLSIPAATAYDRPISASLSGNLSSNSSLAASLGGSADVQIS